MSYIKKKSIKLLTNYQQDALQLPIHMPAYHYIIQIQKQQYKNICLYCNINGV